MNFNRNRTRLLFSPSFCDARSAGSAREKHDLNKRSPRNSLSRFKETGLFEEQETPRRVSLHCWSLLSSIRRVAFTFATDTSLRVLLVSRWRNIAQALSYVPVATSERAGERAVIFHLFSKNVPRFKYDRPSTTSLDSRFLILHFRVNSRTQMLECAIRGCRISPDNLFVYKINRPLPSLLPSSSSPKVISKVPPRDVLSMHLRGRAAVRDA